MNIKWSCLPNCLFCIRFLNRSYFLKSRSMLDKMSMNYCFIVLCFNHLIPSVTVAQINRCLAIYFLIYI